MRWTPWTLAVVGAVVLACTCGPPDAPLVRPPRGAAPVELAEVPASRVSVPVTLTVDLIRDRVVQSIPPVLLDVKGQELDHGIVADITAERTGKPRVKTGSGIEVVVPIGFSVVPRAGKAAKLKLGEVTGEVEVTVTLRPQLADDWNLVPRPRLSHRWLEEPVLKVGPLKVGVRKIADAALVERLDEVADTLARDLPRELGLRTRVKEAWQLLAEPRLIRDDPRTHLVFAPDALYADDIITSSEGVHLTVGASGDLAIVLGKAPPAARAKLPPRQPVPGPPGVQLAADIEVGWPVLTNALRESVVGQKIREQVPGLGDATVTITEVIDCYPSKRSVAVGLRARAKAAGTTLDVELWLSGRPVLRADTLRIVDFEHVARSTSSWFDAIHAVVADELEERVAQELVLPLGSRRDELLTQLRRDLDARPPREGLALEVDITSAELARIYPTDSALMVGAVVSGTLTVEVLQTPQ